MDWRIHKARLAYLKPQKVTGWAEACNGLNLKDRHLFDYFEDRLNNLEQVVQLQSDLIKSLMPRKIESHANSEDHH